MTNSLGTRIKYLRSITKMSQDELGKRVGVQRAAINKYEKGTVENIPIKTIEKIAEVFEVSPIYILGWDSEGGDPLSMEVKIIGAIQRFYGAETVELLETYIELTPEGKQRVYQYAIDMAKLYS